MSRRCGDYYSWNGSEWHSEDADCCDLEGQPAMGVSRCLFHWNMSVQHSSCRPDGDEVALCTTSEAFVYHSSLCYLSKVEHDSMVILLFGL